MNSRPTPSQNVLQPGDGGHRSFLNALGDSWHTWIAIGTLPLLAIHLAMRWTHWGEGIALEWWSREIFAVQWPLFVILVAGGTPLVGELLMGLVRGKFGSDLLAAMSILASVWLGEYLAGSIVVLMLSGGQALESYAMRNASKVLSSLASRVPTQVHRIVDGEESLVSVESVRPGDRLRVYPHEICPADGVVALGHGSMDESYLSGEPYRISKSIGSEVLSGAINGAAVLEITATREAKDSRYAKIMRVMQESSQHRPQIRRLGDQLGAIYTPIAVAIALLAWWLSGDPVRFLAVLVVATPCPLLIAIPVALIGSISLAARHSIIIKDPAILERLDLVQTAMFDKTGTLTYGQPVVTHVRTAPGKAESRLIEEVASLEHYSKHPLASAVLRFAESRKIALLPCSEVHEEPGTGLRGAVEGKQIVVTHRGNLSEPQIASASWLGDRPKGMECVVLENDELIGALQFRDQPRKEGRSFVEHLRPKHGIHRVLLISGDRAEEVEYLATQMGIESVFASQSPEQKLAIVKSETAKAETLYVGDGINDAPALTAATIGIAFGRGSEITSEAADAVVLDSSLERVDQLFHIGRRMRRIALESAVGGMALSLIGMGLACFGWLPPVAGAISQESIDVLAVLNALRAAYPPKSLSDF